MITRASLKIVSEMSPGTGACVSLVCPMNLPGEPARDDLRLANLFRQAGDELREWPAARHQLDAAFAQMSAGADEPRPRRYTLAAYIRPDWSAVELIPELLNTSVTAGPNFWIRPILPFVPMLDLSFHVLALTETSYRLFECNAGFINETATGAASTVEEPLRMELQSHSVGTAGSGARPSMVFHVGGYEPKEQTTRFFAEVDRSVTEERRHSDEPLVLVSTERMVSLYRQITECTHILEEAIIKDPAYMTTSDVYDVTLPVVRQYVESRDTAFLKSPDAELANNISDTIRFAAQGRIHTLFVANEPEIWGAFDTLTGSIEIHGERTNSSEDLLNVAALQTISHGGTAIGVPQNEIPEGRMTFAKYRY